MTDELAATNVESDARIVLRVSHLSSWLALCVTTIGGVVLAGWWFRWEALTSFVPALASMKANTAICFVAVGSSLWLRRPGRDGAGRRRASRALCIFAGSLAALTLMEHALGSNLGVDEFLIADWGRPSHNPGRMSFVTAAQFVLITSAILLLDVRVGRSRQRPAEWLAVPVAVSSLVTLVGYLYGVSSLFGVDPYSTIALHTAIAFQMSSVSLLGLHPDQGLMKFATGQGPGGTLARRMLPAALVVPVALGWLQLEGQKGGLYQTEFGSALYAVSNVICFSLLTWWIAVPLEDVDRVRRWMAATLRDREQLLGRTFDGMGDGVVSTDARACITRMNPVAERSTKFTLEEARGRPFTEVFRLMHETSGEAIESPIHRVLSDGIVVTLPNDTVLFGRDGTRHPISDSCGPIRDENGKVCGAVLVFRDRTEDAQSERALRQCRAEMSAVLAVACDSIIIVDRDGTIVEFSATAEQTFGYSRLEAVGQPFVELLVPASLRDDPAFAFRGSETNDERPGLRARGEISALRRGSREFPIELAVAPIDGEPPMFIACIRDVTEARAAAAALQASEARFQRLIASEVIGVAIADSGGRLLETNTVFSRLTGISRREIVEKDVRWAELTPREWQARDEQASRELSEKEIVAPWRKEYARRDGMRVPVLQSMARLDRERHIALVVDLSEQKRSEDAAARLEDQARAERVARHEAEKALRIAEARLLEAHGMAAVARLSGGVAHDLQNLMSVVLSYTSMMLEEVEPEQPWRAELEQVRRAGERAAVLTRQLLAFGRQQWLPPRVVDLNEIIAGLGEILPRLEGESRELSLVLAARGRVRVDPRQLERVLMGLVLWARDGMRGGGELRVETADVELAESDAREHFELEPGPYVLLSVSQTGAGSDGMTAGSNLEPSFGDGPHLQASDPGVAAALGVVRQSGGSIWVNSGPGHGATLNVYLPRVSEAGHGQGARPATRAPGGSETILLVVDDEQLRTLVATILRRHGYRVLEAPSSGDALLMGEQFPEVIHVLVADALIPRMNGRQLAERLASSRPTMKVMLMSDDPGDALGRADGSSSSVEIIQKPLLPEPLLAKLRRMLDASAG